jgi:hypothetical protein
MDDFIQKVISNTWYALAILILLTGVLHLLLVFPKNLSKKAWKKMDYLWLCLTMAGLISATNTVNSELSKGELEDALYRGKFNLKLIQEDLSPQRSTWVCTTLVRDEYSPHNFDEIASDFKKACAWRAMVFEQISRIDTSDMSKILVNKIPQLQVKEETILDYEKQILSRIDEYNKLVTQKENAKIKITSSSNQQLTFFAPLLLILGFALRLTKISGELRHEK